MVGPYRGVALNFNSFDTLGIAQRIRLCASRFASSLIPVNVKHAFEKCFFIESYTIDWNMGVF